MGIHSLLQGIFPTQGLNPKSPTLQAVLYQLSHKGSPYIYNHPGYGVFVTVAQMELKEASFFFNVLALDLG